MDAEIASCVVLVVFLGGIATIGCVSMYHDRETRRRAIQ